MKIVSSAEMREIDRITTEKFGVTSLTLMENAGSAVAGFILQQYPDKQRVLVVCGKGNNGGDGFVAARKLHEAGKEVAVLLLAHPDEVKGDAKKMLERLPSPPISAPTPQALEQRRDLFKNCDLLLDAIFGTGFRPPLPDLAATAIDLVMQSTATVISVDLPSGVDADSTSYRQGQVCRSDVIVTFTAPKPAVIFGWFTNGPIVTAQIGSPPEAVHSSLGVNWNRRPYFTIPKREPNSNKGMYGHALIIGGSVGKSGAPTMSAMAALRSGAGLVTAAVPRSVLSLVAGAIPELMTEPLDENASGSLSREALDTAQSDRLLARKNVVALGPGLGSDADTAQAVREFVARCSLPLVIDADGLNAFAGNSKLLDGNQCPLVLTPHPGEMARLIAKPISEIEANRIEVARNFAREHHLILVLKGWRTLIADPQGEIWVNTTGNPGLAKGGSGDVLTGIIAGLIAQFPRPLIEAVRLAVYLHGLAADLALEKQTERTMLASDVIAALVPAFHHLEKPSDDFAWIQGEAQHRA